MTERPHLPQTGLLWIAMAWRPVRRAGHTGPSPLAIKPIAYYRGAKGERWDAPGAVSVLDCIPVRRCAERHLSGRTGRCDGTESSSGLDPSDGPDPGSASGTPTGAAAGHQARETRKPADASAAATMVSSAAGDSRMTCLRRPAGPPRRAALRAAPRQRSRAAAWPRDAPGRPPEVASNAAELARDSRWPACRPI